MKYSVIDIEATGGSPKLDRIMEIAVYNYDGESVFDSFSTLINPEVDIPPYIQKLTGIKNEMLEGAPSFEDVAERLIEMTSDTVFVAHNVNFDYSILKNEFKRLGKQFTKKKLCTVELSKLVLDLESYSLDNLTKELNINMESHHRAGDDAKATVEVLEHLLNNDTKGLIQKRLDSDFDHYNLPEVLTEKEIKKIPEDTGVYYFLNTRDELVYAGSTNDLRERVLNHFLPVPGSKKRERLQQNVTKVDYEETGSELIARLKEAQAILSKKPMFNRRIRISELPYGIFIETNTDGYKYLFAKKLNKGEESLAAFRTREQAEAAIYKRMDQYGLCPKLCGKYRGDGACGSHKVKRCKGACVGKESTNSYNRKVNRAFRFYKMPHDRFLIIGEGRNVKEASAVLVSNRHVEGYCYFKKSASDYSEIAENINAVPSHPLFKNIILKYLSKPHLDLIHDLAEVPS